MKHLPLKIVETQTTYPEKSYWLVDAQGRDIAVFLSGADDEMRQFILKAVSSYVDNSPDTVIQ